MKSRNILIFLLVSVAIFHFLRKKGLEEYHVLKQIYNFELPAPQNGDLKIERPKQYLLLHTDEKNGQDEVKKGLEELFKFSKVLYKEQNITDKTPINFQDYDVIILVGENYKGLTKELYDKIKERVEKGGKLFITGRSYRSPFNSLAGIKKVGDFIETKSFKFTKEIFPGFNNTKPGPIIFGSSGISVELDKDVDILATTKDNKPLMWTKKYGEGLIYYNNSTLFQGKIFRGIMKQMLSYIDDVSFYPILNTKVMQIDDFPSPIPVVKNQIIKDEYGMDTAGFFNIIWWQDMQGIADRQKLALTGLVIAEYNDATVKSKIVPLKKRTLEELSKRGRELISQGGEIGLHGYNHYSLGLKGEINYDHYGYTPWGSVEEMITGINIAKESIKEVFGKDIRIYSYVAPSNLLPKSGKEALVKALPYINSFCGIFYGEMEPGLLLQEVGRDPDFPQVYALPRFSSGFFCTETIMWQIYNGIAGYGYFSHFIHPDDIMDKERGQGKTWGYLSQSFEEIFHRMNTDYPVLKPVIQSDMTRDFMEIENLKIAYEMKENKVYVNIENFRGEFDSHFRVSGKKIRKIKGGKYILIEKTKEYSLYIITAEEPELEITLEDL